MSNEIAYARSESDTLYAHVTAISNKYIYDVGDTALEAVGTWNDARADECDISMVATGSVHFADFPTVAAGIYLVQIKLQTGESPAIADDIIAQGWCYWTGTAEINPYTLAATLLGTVVEGSVTLEQAVRLMLAILTGKSSGGGTDTLTFRDIGDTKNRVVATVDVQGNRTDVNTRDGS